MGYRPSIYVDGELMIEFGKFYGYVDHHNLKSIIWLEDHGKIEPPVVPSDGHGDDAFLGGWGPEIGFTADEFREFWDLYIQDINEYDYSVDAHIIYDKPYDPETTWAYYSGSSRTTFKEAVYDTDDEKTIIWG